jgi:hypothetical protein
MGADDRALREAFRFEPPDLVANRAGRLSPRQAALLRAGRIGMWLSLAVFSAVMLGTVGFVALLDRRLDTPGGPWSGVGMAAAIAVAVILVGAMLSRGYIRAARSQQVAAAQGVAEVVADAPGDCRIRIGPTELSMPGVEHLAPFRPDAEYRVYYLAGPRPIVLSAENLARETHEGGADAETGERATAGEPIAVVRRGYVVVVLLGVLALGIPLAGIMVGDLPPRLRPLAWITLFAVAIGFVWLSVSWLERGGRSR